MKIAVALLTLAFSFSALAQSDDYDQAGFPNPIPKGEIAIDALKEIKLTKDLVVTAYVEKTQHAANVYGAGEQSADVNCNLSASEVELSNFNLLKRESVGGGTGARVYLSLKDSATLKYKTSSLGVEEVKPWCNGEPELCQGSSHYAHRTEVIATDKSGNSWNLSCLAPFSRTVYASDVKIEGLKIK